MSEKYYQNTEPDYSYEMLTDISVNEVKRMGLRALAVDLDDTVVLYGSYHVYEGVREWVEMMENAGIRVVVISNTVPIRGIYLSRKMGTSAHIAPAFKPHTFGLRMMASKLGIPVSQIGMIGDRLSTDILSANKIGAVSIKVEPLKQLVSEKRNVPMAMPAK